MRIYEADGGEVFVKASQVEPLQGHFYRLEPGENELRFQCGTVSESGHNGTTSEAVIACLVHRLQYLDSKSPCRENQLAITKLQEALMWLEKRTADRLARGVEGKDEV